MVVGLVIDGDRYGDDIGFLDFGARGAGRGARWYAADRLGAWSEPIDIAANAHVRPSMVRIPLVAEALPIQEDGGEEQLTETKRHTHRPWRGSTLITRESYAHQARREIPATYSKNWPREGAA